jgi:type I restriction enzyme R subunit
MRIAVKKILRKHGYPPDMELKATETVIEQAKLLANDFGSKLYEQGGDTLSIAADPGLF